jgi:hypothetical protein
MTIDQFIKERNRYSKIPKHLRKADCKSCSYYQGNYCPRSICVHKQLVLHLRGIIDLEGSSKELKLIREFERLGFEVEWEDTKYSLKKIIKITKKSD